MKKKTWLYIVLIALAVGLSAWLLVRYNRARPEPAVPSVTPRPTPEVIVKETEVEKIVEVEKEITSSVIEDGLRDIGVHTEMLCDAYVAMAEGGCISGKYKTTDPGKIVYTFAMGTKKLYDFLDGNPDCLLAPVDYTNDPYIIARNDNMVCLNNAIEVDLYGQVASESSGTRQISGTGGQLDFIQAAARSKGGKGLVCLSSTYTDRDGIVRSRILPHLGPCQIVTVPRSFNQFVITEYGIADLRAKTTWERAEELISIAHPDFREELIRNAEAQGLRIRHIRE